MSSSTATEQMTTRGWLGDDHGALPLTAVDIDADVCELVATTVVRQTFRNTRSEPVEASYVFPLPDRAGVTAFTADLAGRVVDGALKERATAREEYDEAVASGRRAAIAEEDRPGVFTTRVGNLLPGEDAVVTLTLTGPLPVDDGRAEYRFPLVVAPRYVPGAALPGPDVGGGVARDTDRVPDASRITPPVLLPGQESPVRLSLQARLRVDGLEPSAVHSSMHDVDVTADEDGSLAVRLRPGERLNRDVVLHWPAGWSTTRTTATYAPDADREEGTWQVTVVPPAEQADNRPRDVVVVLDRSGSMSGWKMVAARRAAARIVDTLASADTFAVLAFDTRVERPWGLEDGLASGTDQHRWAAVSWLAGLEARGGTEMLQPLTEAVRALEPGAAERDRYVVLVTDGQVGNEDEIVRALEPTVGSVRVFALGIDQAVNAGFLRRVAAVGAGRCDLVESEERLDAVMAQLHRRIAPPLATALTVTVEGTDLVPDETAPQRATDLFAGVPTVLSGRYRGAVSTGVRFHVRGEGFADAVRGRQVTNEAVRTVWARARIRDLEDSYVAADAADDALAERIVATSLEHRVLSRFTAFVAVDHTRTTGSREPQPVLQPVELPSGWSSAAMHGAAVAMAAPAPGGAVPPTLARQVFAGARESTVARDVQPTIEPYRARVEDLLERIDSGEVGDAVVRDLEQFADDLASVEVSARVVDAVRRLLAAVRRDRGEVARAAAELRAEIDRSTTHSKTRSGRERGRFWRR